MTMRGQFVHLRQHGRLRQQGLGHGLRLPTHPRQAAGGMPAQHRIERLGVPAGAKPRLDFQGYLFPLATAFEGVVDETGMPT